ncbi:MAG: hypothetical protein OXT71_08285 [Acidobacteriota bacterium]|nr:hypothetical protein [Acidobacteriota bacterium]
MKAITKKYNPGFLTDDELLQSFCVRTGEFESIVETLSESTGNSNPHIIVIGPRGSGKTHLLLRVAVEIRRNPKLERFFPVVFAEESYEVTTCGEFWLECLGRLADQAPSTDGVDLHRTYEDLRSSPDDFILSERCLGVLLDFADRHSQRLVLLVENLNMLFADMLDPDAGWRLRKTLQTEPRILLLGSATSRFKEIDHPENALYDLFRIITLNPLNTSECATLWKTVSGRSTELRTIRPLQILTGGSPRLLTIVSFFGAGQSFRELMENLLALVDDHTEYFKSHLDSLPVQERRVYLALARLWKPSLSREIADLARLDTNRCSALLARLLQRGAVTVEGGTARRKQYYLTERLYNIYYLLRRGSGAAAMVDALIQFMASYYSPERLLELGKRIAAETGVGDQRARELAREAFANLLDLPLLKSYRETLLTHEDVVSAFGSSSSPEIAPQIAYALIAKAAKLGPTEPALTIYDDVIDRFGSSETSELLQVVQFAYVLKAAILIGIGRNSKAVTVCDDIVNRFRTRRDPASLILLAMAFFSKGSVLHLIGDAPNALYALDQALDRLSTAEAKGIKGLTPMVSNTILGKGHAYHKNNQPGDALAAYNEIATRFGGTDDPQTANVVAKAVVKKVILQCEMNRTVSENEVVMLLEHLPAMDYLPVGCVPLLIQFCVMAGPIRALELIQGSPASDRLLPLVTALEQILGRSPRVAREVEEIAADIRQELEEKIALARS